MTALSYEALAPSSPRPELVDVEHRLTRIPRPTAATAVVGVIVSLAVVAIFLLVRIRVLFGRELGRIELAGWEKTFAASAPHRVD